MMPPPCALRRAPVVSFRLIPGGLGGAMGVTVSGSVKVPICAPGATVQLVTSPARVVVAVPEPTASPSSLVPQATNARQRRDARQRKLETVCRIEKRYHAYAFQPQNWFPSAFDFDTQRRPSRLRAPTFWQGTEARYRGAPGSGVGSARSEGADTLGSTTGRLEQSCFGPDLSHQGGPAVQLREDRGQVSAADDGIHLSHAGPVDPRRASGVAAVAGVLRHDLRLAADAMAETGAHAAE